MVVCIVKKAKAKANESADRNGKTVVRIQKGERTSVSCCDHNTPTAHGFLRNTPPALSSCWENHSARLEFEGLMMCYEVVKVRKEQLRCEHRNDFKMGKRGSLVCPMCANEVLDLIIHRISIRMILLRDDKQRNRIVLGERVEINV